MAIKTVLTVIIIKRGDGEYDSYSEDIEKVYVIRARVGFRLEDEYDRYKRELLAKEMGIECTETQFTDHEGNLCTSYLFPKFNRQERKQWADLLKKHTVHFFVEKVLDGKMMPWSDFLL